MLGEQFESLGNGSFWNRWRIELDTDSACRAVVEFRDSHFRFKQRPNKNRVSIETHESRTIIVELEDWRRSPIGRDTRLKIVQVRVQVPPAPISSASHATRRSVAKRLLEQMAGLIEVVEVSDWNQAADHAAAKQVEHYLSFLPLGSQRFVMPRV